MLEAYGERSWYEWMPMHSSWPFPCSCHEKQCARECLSSSDLKCLYWAVCSKAISQMISTDNIKHIHGHPRPKTLLYPITRYNQSSRIIWHRHWELQTEKVICGQGLRGCSEQTTATDCLLPTWKLHFSLHHPDSRGSESFLCFLFPNFSLYQKSI